MLILTTSIIIYLCLKRQTAFVRCVLEWRFLKPTWLSDWNCSNCSCKPWNVTQQLNGMAGHSLTSQCVVSMTTNLCVSCCAYLPLGCEPTVCCLRTAYYRAAKPHRTHRTILGHLVQKRSANARRAFRLSPCSTVKCYKKAWKLIRVVVMGLADCLFGCLYSWFLVFNWFTRI